MQFTDAQAKTHWRLMDQATVDRLPRDPKRDPFTQLAIDGEQPSAFCNQVLQRYYSTFSYKDILDIRKREILIQKLQEATPVTLKDVPDETIQRLFKHWTRDGQRS